MSKMLVQVRGLDALSENAQKIIQHVEAIRALQSRMGPYDGVSVEICIEERADEGQ